MIKKITVQKNAQLVCFLPWIPMEDVRGHYKKKHLIRKSAQQLLDTNFLMYVPIFYSKF